MFGVVDAARRTSRDRARRRAAASLHVLVAEDNPVNRKLVTTLLSKRGHKVKAVDNGRQAVEASTRPTTRRSTSS